MKNKYTLSVAMGILWILTSIFTTLESEIPHLKNSALLVIDMQNDFVCPNGSLYVPNSCSLIDPIKKVIFQPQWDLIVFTQDWHPYDHVSFKEFGGPWPRHCVQNTWGAQINCGLRFHNLNQVNIKKGFVHYADFLSAFGSPDHKLSTGLNELLTSFGIKNIILVGVAFDFCVYYTALDARFYGYNVYIIENLTRSIAPNPQKKRQNLLDHGVKIICGN